MGLLRSGAVEIVIGESFSREPATGNPLFYWSSAEGESEPTPNQMFILDLLRRSIHSLGLLVYWDKWILMCLGLCLIHLDNIWAPLSVMQCCAARNWEVVQLLGVETTGRKKKKKSANKQIKSSATDLSHVPPSCLCVGWHNSKIWIIRAAKQCETFISHLKSSIPFSCTHKDLRSERSVSGWRSSAHSAASSAFILTSCSWKQVGFFWGLFFFNIGSRTLIDFWIFEWVSLWRALSGNVNNEEVTPGHPAVMRPSSKLGFKLSSLL